MLLHEAIKIKIEERLMLKRIFDPKRKCYRGEVYQSYP